MNDDRRSTDERIAEAARELFHAPPPSPRDEMWSEIRARLDRGTGSGGDPDATDGARPLRPGAGPRQPGPARAPDAGGHRLAWWIGIAAALVIGLGIGRLSMSSPGDGARMAATGDAPIAGPTAAAGESIVAGESPAGETVPETVAGGEPAAASETVAAPAEVPPRLAAEEGAPVEMAAEARPDAPRGAVTAGPGRAEVPYLVTTRQHIYQSESLLTGVRTALETGTQDPQFEAWARSLLGRTRLLLASPAAKEPATRRLLEDLELMLAQIVVTAASGDPAEKRILGQGLEDGDLLYRLRSATQDDIRPGRVRAPRTSSL